MTTLDLINEVLFWMLWALLLWQSYIILFNKGVPNIKTAPAIRDFVIERFQAHAVQNPSQDFKIYELGSGNGKFSRQMAKALPEAQVIAIEISFLAYWRSVLLQKLSGIQNLRHIRSDFTKIDLSDAGALFIFQLPSVMNNLRDKLKEEIRPSALIICNKFPIGGGWEPSETIDVKTLMPHQKTVYLYKIS